ncbi:MAG: bifunctional precorrin-2 dehydrogenase/sirohydrochlorin ferrochelatase [Candidatus Aureabacteria bacterium]|nr:bifunctional precorrin-2 dehydrogenase/sirohydrochlorin ferrochelatase [Candidatus Auribacterota bacterium]
MRSRPLYPIFLNLNGRDCLVVGGGSVAERKVLGLLASGARVSVIAPEACPRLKRLGRARRIRLVRRRYAVSDLRGQGLVIAATDDPATNARVTRDARAKGILVNVADAPALCDFYLPATLRRGDLQIAVSTKGRSPALAKRIRMELEGRYGPEYAALLNQAARLRPPAITRLPAGRRAGAFMAITGPRVIRLLRAGRKIEARRLMAEIVRRAAERPGKRS